MKLFSEIKRRQVIQGGIAYSIVGWLLIQLAIALEASLELPAYIDRWVTIAVIAGFPIAIILAWVFDISLGGIRLAKDRETDVPAETTIAQAVDNAPPLKHSIAVLPFADMSPEGDQEYLGDGVAEEILNALVKVTPLRVTGRTSSFSFKGKDDDIQSIGKTLKVAHVLEGSVRKQGDRVRITAQLIQVSDGFHMWSETYDGDLKDIFDLQDTISKYIVSELEILLDAEGARLVSNLTNCPEAYEAFLRGRELFHKLVGEETLPQAVKHFEKAVELDPQFDEAWAHLALSHLNLPDHAGADDPADHYSAAEIAIGRAQATNAESALVERANALILCAKRDFFGAVRSYQRAYDLDPADSFLSFGFGYALNAVGLHEKAIELLHKSELTDPTAPLTLQNLGNAYYSLEQFDAAILNYKKANNAGYVLSRFTAAFVESDRGRVDEAYRWMRDYLKDAAPWFKDRLKSPLARYFYYAASLRKTKFASWLVGRATLARTRKDHYKPFVWDAAALLFVSDPKEYFDFVRENGFAYGFSALIALWYPRDTSRSALHHKDFPQFAEDIGLVKIWQAYGWPEQIQPNPGTDGSNQQFTVN